MFLLLFVVENVCQSNELLVPATTAAATTAATRNIIAVDSVIARFDQLLPFTNYPQVRGALEDAKLAPSPSRQSNGRHERGHAGIQRCGR
jgi:hypothetical protein